MGTTVHVPTPLRKLTGQKAQVQVEAATVAAAVEELEFAYPGMGAKLLDEQGAVRRYVSIYVNDEDIRFQDGTATALKDGDHLSIVPAIAGGR